jgi:hypothetical protein
LISFALDETKLTIKNKPEGAEIIKLINAQEYVNQLYPNKSQKKEITKLDISQKNLEGNLNLSDFVNLEVLDCFGNKLTSLNLSNCFKLKEIYCNSNQLADLDLSNYFNLISLNCSNNSLTNLVLPRDVSSLKELSLWKNRLDQNLSFLQGAIN